MKLIWTRRAADQLESVVEAIAVDHPCAAAEWAGRIVDAAEELRRLPLRGRKVPEFADRIVRELVLPPYRVIYEPAADHLTLLSIKHCRQELSDEDVRRDYP